MKNTNIIMLALTLFLAGIMGVQAQKGQQVTPVIIMPAGTEHNAGEIITFACAILEETSQYQQVGPYTYSWVSNIDGSLGEGASVSTDHLSPGTHIITLYATDQYGKTLTAQKTIIVRPANLTVRISTSDAEGFYRTGERVEMEAAIRGGVPPYSYSWTIDKVFAGSENRINRVFTQSGPHRVELIAKDSAGSTAYASTTVTAYPVSAENRINLTARISSPSGNRSYMEGEPVRFKAEASGGMEPYQFLWTTGEGTVLSRQMEFTLPKTPTTGHRELRIHLTVTDAQGVSASDTVRMTVKRSCILDGICSPGENYLNCPQDCSGKNEGLCDRSADGRCDQDCTRNEDPDCACNRNGICESPYEEVANCPSDCPTGASDGRCDAIKDGRCDPDCTKNEDTDCSSDQSFNYFIIAVLCIMAITIILYLRFKYGR